jgi:uncharacterized protein
MNSGLKAGHKTRVKRFVLDTNVLISASLYPQSIAARAVTVAFRFGTVYRSQETLQEIKTVLDRPKFDRYFVDRTGTRSQFLTLYEKYAVETPITEVSTDCVDPKDNPFLSLALSCRADILVSGDHKHLLPMHPYRGIAILSVTDFVALLARND